MGANATAVGQPQSSDDSAPPANVAQALTFLENVAGLAGVPWHAVALAHAQRDERAVAQQALLALLDDPALAWPVWEVSDAIDAVVFSLTHRTPGSALANGRRALLQSVLSDAALAVLLRDRLCASHVARLYAPFATVLPLDPPQRVR
jgi:hypothetical protein